MIDVEHAVFEKLKLNTEARKVNVKHLSHKMAEEWRFKEWDR